MIKPDGKIIEYHGKYDIVSPVVCADDVQYIGTYQIDALILALKEAKKNAYKDRYLQRETIRVYGYSQPVIKHGLLSVLLFHKPDGEKHKALGVAPVIEDNFEELGRLGLGLIALDLEGFR